MDRMEDYACMYCEKKDTCQEAFQSMEGFYGICQELNKDIIADFQRTTSTPDQFVPQAKRRDV